MKKIICLLTALLLCLLLPLGASAARFPEKTWYVTDQTGLLSAETDRDAAAYALLLEQRTGLRMNTVVVFFLDGLDAQTYANNLFAAWELGDDDILLLIAAGEDSFALAMGSAASEKLGAAAESLLYTSGFSTAVNQQDYDGALRAYFTGFNELSAIHGKVSMGSLFTEAGTQPTATKQPYSSAHRTDTRYDDEDEGGLSSVGWGTLAILLIIVISQSNPVKRARRKRR